MHSNKVTVSPRLTTLIKERNITSMQNAKLFIQTPQQGYYFSAGDLHKISQHYGGAVYMGYWCLRNQDGSWTEAPVEVFYQPNPRLDLGHSHYFGMYVRDGRTYITAADSAFSEPITGVITDDGEVIVSRYRHDCVTKGGHMIDGGRDYTRSSAPAKFAQITVEADQFRVEPLT
jgi:hypothetical protein